MKIGDAIYAFSGSDSDNSIFAGGHLEGAGISHRDVRLPAALEFCMKVGDAIHAVSGPDPDQ